MTPEPFSKYLAERVYKTFREDEEMVEGDEDGDGNTINILDAFAGVGGNLIQFAKRGYCVGVDNDPVKVEYTRHNAKVYGLSEFKDF